MSRVAKKKITVGGQLKLDILGQDIKVSNGKNEMHYTVHDSVQINNDENGLCFSPKIKTDSWAQSGTTRARVYNMVHGLSKGFSKQLELVGVGYRVKEEGRVLVFSLGYSHPIRFELPDAISVTIEKNVLLTLTSYDKHLLGQVCANIYDLRRPDPYKGKGVRIVGKVLKLREVKKK